MERIALLNGKNKNQDYDLAKIFKSLATSGVVEGLEVQEGKVIPGYAFIDVTRDNKTFPILYENTEDIIIDTSGTVKVYIEIHQINIDDGSNNSADGTGIGEIKTSENYPINNFIKLARIDNGVITNEREFIGIKDDKITKQGNIFNGVNQLVKTGENGQINPDLIGSPIVSNVQSTGTYGETISIGNALYLHTDGKLYKARADDLTKVKVLCHANENGAPDEVKKIVCGGLAENQTNLSSGPVFLSNTPGLVSSTPGTNTVYLGESLVPTKYIMKPLYRTDYGLGIVLGTNSGTAQGANWVNLVTFTVTGTINKKIKALFNSYKWYASSYSVWGQGRIVNASDVVQWSAVFYSEGTSPQSADITLAPGIYRLQGASNNASYPNNGIGQATVYDEVKTFI